MSQSIGFSSQLADEEGYIYLQGRAESLIQVSVAWAMMPDKPISVPLNRRQASHSDQMEYLPIKIAECLEQYPVFEGLSGLTAFNIRRYDGSEVAKVRSRQTGDMSREIRPEELLMCDVAAADLWLRVKISCLSVGISLRFDIKVLKSATIQQVKSAVFAYIVEMMRMQGKEVACGLEDLQLAQASQAPDSPCSGTKEASPVLMPLEDAAEVGKCFNFVSCFAVGTLICPENKQIRTRISQSHGSASVWQKPEDFLSKTLSVRNVKIEEMPLTPSSQHQNSSMHGNLRCMSCILS